MTAQPGLPRQSDWGEGASSATVDTAFPTLEQPGSLAGPGPKRFNRRELLTYVWVGTFAALTVGTGVAGYRFLYPRRPVNKLGGRFYLGAAANLPQAGSEPLLNREGRFWLANSENGVQAFYQLCTHAWGGGTKLWWLLEKDRFECPVCGSRFSLEGHYFDGPAPRSLDQFAIEIVVGRTTVSKTAATEVAIEPPYIPSPDAEIVVDTGSMIEGLPSQASPLVKRQQSW